MKDELWSLTQRSRGLQGLRSDLGILWRDQAAHTINSRYLNPQNDDDASMQQALAQQEEALGQAQLQLAEAQEQAINVSKLSQEIAYLLQEISKDVSTANGHYEAFGRYNTEANAKFPVIIDLIRKANCSCNDPAEMHEDIGIAADEYGAFSILDWSGYPGGSNLRPKGPFKLLPPEEYEHARKEANSANRAIHRANPALKGVDIHEIHPVKFGGSPTDQSNKIPLSRSEHLKYTAWWNRMQKASTST